MKNTIRRFSAFLFLAAIFINCSDTTAPNSNEIPQLPRNLKKSEQALIESSNSFGFDLFKKLSNDIKDSNLFISPVSVSMALGMTMNGAASSTLEAMRSTLGFENLAENEINKSYQSLIKLLRNLDPKVKFQIANSIWYRNGFAVLPAFIDVNQTFFDAVVQGLDFSQDAAADTMNGWIDEQTDGLIKQILDKPIDPNTVMFLLNAIYFKGTWTYQFDEEHTQDASFYLHNTESTTCKMMSLSGDFDYAETDELQVIDLPYNDGYFAMTVLLPESDIDTDSLISVLSDEKWNNMISGLSKTTVNLYLPKFKLEWFRKLNDSLTDIGMGIAFNENLSDFTRINSEGELYISEVRHKSFIEVDEEGTEAAAATSVEITYKSGSSEKQNITMWVNHPFIFAIRERASGTILFMGKIYQPEWTE
ncbi:MAG: serpin family protein [Candidatus Marinimicrobia bacterium]|nr:serpin family protein [Candidatus Neomarinimicrobiota bacterium]